MREVGAAALPEGRASTDGAVARVMRYATTTIERDAHVAAAAYLIRRAGATAIVVIDDESNRRPLGILTESDIVQMVADGKDLNDVRVRDLMTSDPTTCPPGTTIQQAAQLMTGRNFRHLPVVDRGSVVGMVDITDVSRALLDAQHPPT